MSIWSSLFGKQEITPAVPGQMISSEKLPVELAPYYKDILTKAQALYNERTSQGYQPYEGPTLAEFTPAQQQVQTGIAGLVGSQAPAYQEAMGMTREAATPFSTEQIEEYMSPYQQAVTDIEKREATKQYQTGVVPQLAAKAAMTQPFGGSRQAILEGMAADTQQRLLGDIQAKGSAQSYQDAISRLDADRLAKGQGASQLANIAAGQYKGASSELSQLQLSGEEQQRQNQTALDEAFKQYLEEQQYPYSTMGKYQSMVIGAPMGTTTYSKPQAAVMGPSFGQQLIGGLGGLGNIYGSFTGRTIGGQDYIQPGQQVGGQTGGGISSLIKRQNGDQVGDIKSSFEIDEDVFKQNPSTAPMINKYYASLGTVEEAYARARQSQLKNQALAKQQVDYQKSSLEADRANQQFHREQAAFTAMAKLGTDQDVTDAPGGGAGQILTMLGKAGPEIGASEKERRAKLRESQTSLIDLEMQYNKALADGDMTLAMQLSEVMSKGAKTEIDIGNLNATLAKNDLDSTLEVLKLAKVSEPVQKTMRAHAANMLGYTAIFDANNRLRVNKSGKALVAADQVALSRVERILQNIYDVEMRKNSNQATALAAVMSYVLPDNINIPNVSGQIVIPDINTSISKNLKLNPGKVVIP